MSPPMPSPEIADSRRHEPPAPPVRIALFAVAALAAGIFLAKVIEGEGPHPFSGTLHAATTCITADRAGRLMEFQVEEGAPVVIGSPLLTLADSALAEQIAEQQRSIDQLTVELSRARAGAELDLAWRVKDLSQDITDIQLRSAAYLKEKFDFELQKTMLADVLASGDTALFEGGNDAFESLVLRDRLPRRQRINTALQLEAAANAVEVCDAQVEFCDLRIKELKQQLQHVPDQVRRAAGIDVAEMRLKLAHDQLAALDSRQERLVLNSTAIGTVGVFRKSIGDHIRPGDAIVDLLDDARRHVVVDVPSSHVSAFSIGCGMTLIFPGNETREGRIFRIAPQAEPGSLRDRSGDSLICVHVEPTGAVWPDVPIGSRVIAKLAKQQAP